MGHLGQTQKGWENEHLATFLLSRIAFISNPLTIADDLGVDVLCTLFEPRIVKKSVQLFPKHAFAIQIKSSSKPIPADSNLPYFQGLEIPFFVGVVDQKKALLEIYSGEFFPYFFSAAPPPFSLRLRPQKHPVGADRMEPWSRNKEGKFTLPMPFVAQLSANDSAEAIEATRQALIEKCYLMLKNIAARISCEYVFEFREGNSAYYRILAGSGSERTFRNNFMLRLAEVFYNLRHIFDSKRPQFDRREFDEYEKCFLGLKKLGLPSTDAAERLHGDLRRALDAESATAGKCTIS